MFCLHFGGLKRKKTPCVHFHHSLITGWVVTDNRMITVIGCGRESKGCMSVVTYLPLYAVWQDALSRT